MKDFLIDKNDKIININEYFYHMSGPKRTLHKGKLIKDNNEIFIEWDDGLITKYTDLVFYDKPEWNKYLIEKCI